MNQKLKFVALGLLCAFIAGCGGGGGDDSFDQAPAPTRTTAEGFWVGTLLGNGVSETYTVIVLENGDTWGVEISGGSIVGITFGHTVSSGNHLSGALSFPGALPYTGSFIPKGSLSAQFGSGAATATYTASYDPSYDEAPPSLSAVAGSYTGITLDGLTGETLSPIIPTTISPSGTVTLSPVNGCGASGTIRPRASGKGIFDVTLRFQGSACTLGDGTAVQGQALYSPEDHGLMMLTMQSGTINGFFFGAVK
jgi:hypothetical protein